MTRTRTRTARLAAAVMSIGLLTGFLAVGVTAPASAAPTSAAPTPLAVGKTATFAHLKVTVTKTERSKKDSYFFGAKVKVCVTSLPAGQSSLRLSWDPWTVNGGVAAGMFDGASPWEGAYAPTEGQYTVGQCMTGWLPFAVKGSGKITNLRYANALGNVASWKVTNGASPQLALGQTRKFTYFTVQVTQTEQSDQGFRAYAKVCVRKLPPGSTGGRTRVSWDPWAANAGTHFGFTPSVFDASHTWANLFPASKKYKVGQCAKGWVPFEGVSTDLTIDRVAYRNSLGDVAFWTAAS